MQALLCGKCGRKVRVRRAGAFSAKTILRSSSAQHTIALNKRIFTSRQQPLSQPLLSLALSRGRPLKDHLIRALDCFLPSFDHNAPEQHLLPALQRPRTAAAVATLAPAAFPQASRARKRAFLRQQHDRGLGFDNVVSRIPVCSNMATSLEVTGA